MRVVAGEGQSTERPQAGRYRLVVMPCPDSGVRVQVVDCRDGFQVFDWRGYVARHLLNSGELDREQARLCGCYPCTKTKAWHLALVAAAARTVYTGLSPLHQRVTGLLLSNPSHHHTADDVGTLLAAECREVAGDALAACLDDLVARNVVQRIDVDAQNVFYDVNTRPHEHVFDPVTRTLADATSITPTLESVPNTLYESQ